MSAYLVDKIMIDALITAAHAWALIDARETDSAGLTLWRENAIAAERDEPTTYTHQPLPGRPRPAQVLRWADTYAYQTSSYADFSVAGSPAGQLIARLRSAAITRMIQSWPEPARLAVTDDADAPSAARRSYDYTAARHDIADRNRDTFTW